MRKLIRAFFLLCCLALVAQAQDVCKIERNYDKFTNKTEAVCTVLRLKEFNLLIVAAYEGEGNAKEPEYSFYISRFDAKPDTLTLMYKGVEKLYILAGDYRAQLAVSGYSGSNKYGIASEHATALLSREALTKITETEAAQGRFGQTEFTFTDEARRMMQSFVEQIEGKEK
jgi:hypothetical protein